MSRPFPRDYLLLSIQLMKLRSGSRVLEIGTSRMPMSVDCWAGTQAKCCLYGHSTMLFAAQCQLLWSVDIDPEASELARQNLQDWRHRTTAEVRFLVGDAMQVLSKLSEPVDLFYLDAWDIILGGDYAANHLKAYYAARHLLHPDSVIAIDDVDIDDGGKGGLLIPHLLAEGWQLVAFGRQAILVQDTTGMCSLASWRKDYCGSLPAPLQGIANELVGRVWKYERIGFDSRRMTFSKNGTIVDGAQGCEVFWDLVECQGRCELKIRSLTELTCSLVQSGHSDWVGRWEHHEKMPVRLSLWSDSDEVPRVSPDEKWLIACPVNQLGNCLRGIVSCHILANYYGRKFKVYLGLNGSYSLEYFKSLFDPQCAIDFIESVPEYTVFIGRNQPEEELSEEKLFQHPDGQAVSTFRTTTGLQIEAVTDLTRFDHVGSFALGTILSVCPAGMPAEQYLSARHAWYQSVKWNQQIINAVQEFQGAYRRRVGVHIRYSDNLVDKSKIESGNLTPLSEYFLKLREYSEDTEFVVFTDSREVLSLCRERLGDRVQFPVRRFTGIQQALFEMLLLSQTKEIVGSYLSTFSYESAFMGNRKISLYIDDGWRDVHPSRYESVS